VGAHQGLGPADWDQPLILHQEESFELSVGRDAILLNKKLSMEIPCPELWRIPVFKERLSLERHDRQYRAYSAKYALRLEAVPSSRSERTLLKKVLAEGEELGSNLLRCSSA
jgi:hypothetical protein